MRTGSPAGSSGTGLSRLGGQQSRTRGNCAEHEKLRGVAGRGRDAAVDWIVSDRSNSLTPTNPRGARARPGDPNRNSPQRVRNLATRGVSRPLPHPDHLAIGWPLDHLPITPNPKCCHWTRVTRTCLPSIGTANEKSRQEDYECRRAELPMMIAIRPDR